jgi:hypothetical protein
LNQIAVCSDQAVNLILLFPATRTPMTSFPTELFWLAGGFIMLMACLLAVTAE